MPIPAFALQRSNQSKSQQRMSKVVQMLNVLSLMSVTGVFVAAVNIMCAFTPATLIQVLGLATPM